MIVPRSNLVVGRSSLIVSRSKMAVSRLDIEDQSTTEIEARILRLAPNR